MVSATQQGRVILTEDNDFAALATGQGQATVGLIRIALFGFGRATKPARIVAAVAEIGETAVAHVTVIEAN